MKTAEQILEDVTIQIALMHDRPTMHVGSTSQLGAAKAFDGMMWVAHWIWAQIQSREKEFTRAFAEVRECHGCGPLYFAAAFRRENPNADEASLFERVRECWAEVDARLDIDISAEHLERWRYPK